MPIGLLRRVIHDSLGAWLSLSFVRPQFFGELPGSPAVEAPDELAQRAGEAACNVECAHRPEDSALWH